MIENNFKSPLKITITNQIIRAARTAMLELNSKNTWVTSDGREILLKDMDENHLLNSIHFCRKRGLNETAKYLMFEACRRGISERKYGGQ